MVIVSARLRASHTFGLRKLLSQNGFKIYLYDKTFIILTPIKENYDLPEVVPPTIQERSSDFIYLCLYNKDKELPSQEVFQALEDGKAQDTVIQYRAEHK